MLLKKINKTIVCHFILVRIFLLIIFDGEHANKSFFRLLHGQGKLIRSVAARDRKLETSMEQAKKAPTPLDNNSNNRAKCPEPTQRDSAKDSVPSEKEGTPKIAKQTSKPKADSSKKPEDTDPSRPDILLPASSGSGFAISSDGHIITNYHVVEVCQDVKVRKQGKMFSTNIVTFDPRNDLALIKGDFSPSTVFPLSQGKAELLQDIFVAGYPFGRKLSTSVKVTKGIVSSLTGIGNNFSNMQIDAALQPGNSGGPILDNKGNVIGVAVAKLDIAKILEDFGTIPENTNFGIKTSVLRNMLEGVDVTLDTPNICPISNTELGRRITDGSFDLSCMMSVAQIEERQSKKVMFQESDGL